MKPASLFLPILFLLVLCSSCKPKKPSGVLSEEKMKKVLVDYHLAQGMAAGTSDPEKNRYLYIQQVFKKHRVKEAQFDSSMVYYSTHSETMAKIYTDVYNRIETNANKMGVDTQVKSLYSDLSNQGDTANIWSDSKVVTLRSQPLENLYSFRLLADSTFRQGDSFLWHFSTFFVLQGATRDFYAQLVVRYENDSVAAASIVSHSDEEFNLRVDPSEQQDTLSIKSVDGYFYLPQKELEAEQFRMVQVHDIALVRFHPVVEEEQLELDDEDSLSDSTEVDTGFVAPQLQQRLTPTQMRENQPREKTIHVIKEKPVDPRLRPSRNLNGPTRQSRQRRTNRP